MKRLLIIPASILLIMALLNACSDADTSESVKFKVTSYGENFNGSYTVDGDGTTTFSGSSSGNDCYIYEKKMDVEDQLEVEAAPVYEDGETDVYSLEIRIYVDDELVKNIEDSGDDVEKISLTYTTGESDDDDD
jgi:hypothetical protein